MAKLSHAQFTKRAITALRTDGYKGIHTVYSGFNAAFREYYGEDSDPITATKNLHEAGEIVVRYAKGGAVIYLPGDAPEKKDNKGKEALQKVLK